MLKETSSATSLQDENKNKNKDHWNNKQLTVADLSDC